MDINKAIKKQKKSDFRFVLIMCFIFLAFPLILFYLKKFNSFFIVYLCVVNILIVMSIIYKKDANGLSYSYSMGKMKIKQGLFIRTLNIECDKIAYVHTEKTKDGIRIVMLSRSKFRNEHIRRMSKEILRRHPKVAYEYKKMKDINPEIDYFMISIYKGGYIKYKLLIELYKTCVKARYSEAAIDDIKYWSK